MNLVLLIPAVIGFVTDNVDGAFYPYAMSNVFGSYPTYASSSTDPFVMALSLSLLTLSPILLFLVFLGQGVLTGKVISQGNVKLRDWVTEGRKFFFTVLGIGIVNAIVTSRITNLSIRLVDLGDWYTPQTQLVNGLLGLVTDVLKAFFLFWLATLILGHRSFIHSLIAAVKGLRSQLMVFVELILFFWGTDMAISSVLLLIHFAANKPLIGYPIIQRVVGDLMDAILSPLWFLMIFEIYREQKMTSGADSRDNVTELPQ